MPFPPRRRWPDGFPTSLSVRQREENTAAAIAALTQKGQALSPVAIEGRRIATTFWGDAWAKNLERYSDFATRLPRGRSYVRSGAVIDLQIVPGEVRALVSGTDVYDVSIRIGPVTAGHWRDLRRDVSGAIDSVIELLQGHLSHSVMTRMCEPRTGLFPAPNEIGFRCSCPDQAYMCKHVAAVLYGIAARLDNAPELLFVLRRVQHQDLIADAGEGLGRTGPPPASRLLTGNLSEIFGIAIKATSSPKSPSERGRFSRCSSREPSPKPLRTSAAVPVPRRRRSRRKTRRSR